MNIFILDQDPVIAANMMCDKHVVKMIVESCQLLSTAHRVLDGKKVDGKNKKGGKYTRYYMNDSYIDNFLFKSTMINHPCSIWIRETTRNYYWLSKHNIALCNEYTQRYSKIHKCQQLADWLFIHPPIQITLSHRTDFAQAMPEGYKSSNAVEAYRNYYCNEKSKFAKWKKGNTPLWYTEFHSRDWSKYGKNLKELNETTH